MSVLAEVRKYSRSQVGLILTCLLSIASTSLNTSCHLSDFERDDFQSDIRGGEFIPAEKFSAVGVLYKTHANNGHRGQVSCTATLLSPRIAITANHCLHDDERATSLTFSLRQKCIHNDREFVDLRVIDGYRLGPVASFVQDKTATRAQRLAAAQQFARRDAILLLLEPIAPACFEGFDFPQIAQKGPLDREQLVVFGAGQHTTDTTALTVVKVSDPGLLYGVVYTWHALTGYDVLSSGIHTMPGDSGGPIFRKGTNDIVLLTSMLAGYTEVDDFDQVTTASAIAGYAPVWDMKGTIEAAMNRCQNDGRCPRGVSPVLR